MQNLYQKPCYQNMYQKLIQNLCKPKLIKTRIRPRHTALAFGQQKIHSSWILPQKQTIYDLTTVVVVRIFMDSSLK